MDNNKKIIGICVGAIILLTYGAIVIMLNDNILPIIIISFIYLFGTIKIFGYLKEVFKDERTIGNRETVRSEIKSRTRSSSRRTKGKVRKAKRIKETKPKRNKNPGKENKKRNRVKKAKKGKDRKAKKGKR